MAKPTEKRPSPSRIEGFFSVGDALSLYYWGLTPARPARGTVVFVHGVGEHSGRYAAAFASFAQQGYRCFGFDQRGFGRSAGERGHVDTFARYADDLAVFLDQLAVATPGQPVFLLGHSMGTFVVLLYALRRTPSLAGLLIYSCPLKLSRSMAFGGWVARRLADWIPRVRIPTMIKPADLSEDQAAQEAFRRDPKVSGTVTIGWLAAFSRARDSILAGADRIRVPVSINHGSADRIADPAGAAILLDRLGSADKTLKVYHGLRHELLNQRREDRAGVLRQTFDWLDRHAGPWP